MDNNSISPHQPLTPEGHAIRKLILEASHACGQGHIPTSFSIVEMLTAVYGHIRHSPADPSWAERDIFILSKGHAALGLYAVLAQAGYFPAAWLNDMGRYQARLGCHPDRTKVPGVEVSTGSLGHGVALAVGMALAFKLDGSPRRVYTLVGDGESNEGSVWEAVMVATHQRLDNLTVLVDYNQSQRRSLQIDNLAERLAAFGCAASEVNGHDVLALRAALAAPAPGVKAIVARTVKGYGSPTLAANFFEWHRKSPVTEQLAQLLGEINAQTV